MNKAYITVKVQKECIAYMTSQIGENRSMDDLIELGRKKYVTDEEILSSSEFEEATAEFKRRMAKLTPNIENLTLI